MTDVRVPKLNNNDAEYILVEWIVRDDHPVEAGQPIVIVETSKATAELVTEEAGVLWQLKPVGRPCRPGEVIARVVPVGTPRTQQPATDVGGPIVTAPARALMAELGVGMDEVQAMRLPFVKKADIYRLIDDRQSAERSQRRLLELPAHQRAVARTVTLSHQEIPSAYAVVRVDVGAAMAAASAASRRLRLLVGLPELVVAAVARLHAEFPLAYSAPVEEEGPLRTVALAESPHIGVTFDVGKGLTVPVVRYAATLSLADLAKVLSEFRATALKGQFTEENLAGGVITVTLHTDPDVLFAVPVISPGQTCAVALAGSRAEIAPAAEGLVTPRMVTDLGLAYDHRVLNGREAVLYLQAIKRLLESPDKLVPQALVPTSTLPFFEFAFAASNVRRLALSGGVQIRRHTGAT